MAEFGTSYSELASDDQLMASKLEDIVPKRESVSESLVVHPGYQFTVSSESVESDLQQLEFIKYVLKAGVADRGGGKIVISFPDSTYAQVSTVYSYEPRF